MLTAKFNMLGAGVKFDSNSLRDNELLNSINKNFKRVEVEGGSKEEVLEKVRVQLVREIIAVYNIIDVDRYSFTATISGAYSSETYPMHEVLFELDIFPITKKYFSMATKRHDTQDDLERVNCPCVGTSGHSSCGWNRVLDMPRFNSSKFSEIKNGN